MRTKDSLCDAKKTQFVVWERDGHEMADKRDYYEILGIDKSADDETIKKAYRRMAKKYHPDMNPGDKEAEAKFKEVGEAYTVLSDPEKKQIYDQYGHDGLDPSSGMGGQGFGGFGGMDFGDLGDIFGSFFGGGRRESRNGPRRGNDVSVRMIIDFSDAAFGGTKTIEYKRIEKCETCSGSGAKSAGGAQTCTRCKGSGTIVVTQRSMFGMVQEQRACNVCNGRGKVITDPCQNCRGTGNVRVNKKLDVNIPAGIHDGGKICLRGQGDAGVNGGGYGDLYVLVSIRSHEIFEREGNDLYCEIPVSYAELVLGAEIDVPTLTGTVKYTIPEGTQNGTRFILRKEGIVYYNSTNRGDLYFTVVMETPKNLTSEAKKALKEFDTLCKSTNYSKKQRFMDKISKLFKKNKDGTEK